MGEIYRYANSVIVWLGDGNEKSDLAFDFLDKIFQAQLSAYSAEGVTTFTKEKYQDNFRELQLQSDRIYARSDPNFRQKPRRNVLEEIFVRSWFQRAWTLQEVALSRDCLILCGGASMAWDALILCVTFIKRLADDLPDENWFTNTMVQAMPHIYAKTRLSVGKLDGESLGQILYISRPLKASKREDKVFALFWALKAVDETFPPPDYSKPVAEIYREATFTVLKMGGSLNLLQECFDYDGSFDRCSWVPDWSSNPWMPFNNANATKKSSRRIRFSADFKKICLHGKMIDQIQLRTSSLPMASRNLDDFTSPIIDRIRHRISFIRAWQHWVQSTSKLSQYESGQDAFAAFWKLLKLFYYSKRGNLEKWPSEEVIPTFINTLLASQSDSSDYLQFIRQQLSSHWTPAGWLTIA